MKGGKLSIGALNHDIRNTGQRNAQESPPSTGHSINSVRVVHCIASTDSTEGGPSRSVPALCTALAGTGAEVDLLTTCSAEPSEEVVTILPDPPVRSHLIERAGWASEMLRAPLSFRRTLRNLVRTHKPHLLHDHGVWLPNNFVTASVARREGLPLVVSPRGMLKPYAIKFGALKKWVAWHLYQGRLLGQADLFHTTSRIEAEDLRRLGFEQPIVVIPNGVVPPRIPESVLTRRLEPAPPRRALFLSRLHPIKGLPLLLRAWAMLRPMNWELEIAGPDEVGHRAELESFIREEALHDVVTFSGPTSNQTKWNRYFDADLFVLPSHSENFGIVVAEALAARLPVITTQSTPWSALEDEECGWWVDDSVESLAQAVQQATQLSPEEHSDMGKRGRDLVLEKYTTQQAGEKLHEAYLWLLGDGEPPAEVPML